MHATKRIEIRWRDLDGFAHVNNSTYLTYLEEARDEFFTDLLGETVHRVVIRHVEIDFRSGLVHTDDHVDVELELESIGTSSATTVERIRSVADGRIAAEARSVVGAHRRRPGDIGAVAGRFPKSSRGAPVTHLAHWDEASRVRREVGEIAAWMTDLGTAAGSVAVGLRRWEIDPGRRPTPPHAHGAEEEVFYVLAGSGLVWQDGETCEVAAGDCIVHRADEEAHTLRAGPEGLDVLVFGMREHVETCYHPHSGRAWAGATIVKADGPGDMFAFDAEAGPLEWAVPERARTTSSRRPQSPSTRPARATADRSGATWPPRPAPPAPGSTSAAAGPACSMAAALPLGRGGALRRPRRLGHLHPRGRGARAAARARQAIRRPAAARLLQFRLVRPIVQLDAFCQARYIELVPNQNSFGHMWRWLKLPESPISLKPASTSDLYGFIITYC